MLKPSMLLRLGSWRVVVTAFGLLFAYSFWAFRPAGPWMRPLEAAGGMLPETQPGFPPIEPQRSLEALGAATPDYILWQLLDIPYALMNLAFAASAMALGLKALRLEKSILRFLLCLSAIYLLCEAVEDTLVASFASGLIPAAENAVLVQQSATTLKFATGMPAMALGVLSIIIALGAGLVHAFGKRRERDDES